MSKTLVIKSGNFNTNKLTTVTFSGGGSVPCTGIEFSKSSFSLTNYTPVAIEYTLTPSNTTDVVSWASSDTDVVTVSNGTITAVGLGTATITATCGTQTATASVAVSLAYIEDYAFVRPSEQTNFVANSDSDTRIGCFGSGGQAGDYISPRTTTGIDAPVIKLPKNTAYVTVAFSNIGTTLYYGNNVFMYWMKDESCGSEYPTAAKRIESESAYNARNDTSKTFTVPEGADSMLLFFRLDSAPSSGTTAADVVSSVGMTITFNMANA